MQNLKEKLKVGVVGLGHQSLEDHIPAIFASADVDLVAVADIDKEKLKSFSTNRMNIRTYQQFNDLFKSEKLDFVIVAVPHYLHREVTIEAIRRKNPYSQRKTICDITYGSEGNQRVGGAK